MNRVLFCIYTHNTWGGIEEWLHALGRHLLDRGWEVSLGLARGHSFNRPEAFRQRYPDLPAVEIDGRSGTPEGRINAAYRVIRRLRPAIVAPIGLADVFSAVGRLKQAQQQVRLVAALHATNPNLLRDMVLFGPILDLCVGVTPLLSLYLAKRQGLSSDRLTAIVNGRDVPVHMHARRYRVDEPLRILFVGRLEHSSKRVLDLVPLVGELTKRSLPFRLSIVGSGEAEPQLRMALAGASRDNQVIFHGYLPPARLHEDVYPQNDVLIFLSGIGEACPLVLQEALAHGVVPVCSDFLGFHSLEFLRQGETCLLYPCGKMERAADCLEQLIRNPALLALLSEVGKSEARRFTLEASHRRWEEEFERVLDLPIRGSEPGVLFPGREPIRSYSRLERWGLSPAWADQIRRILRRWPTFPDGWGEWPGTISHLDDENANAVLTELYRLDRAAFPKGALDAVP